MGHPCKFQLVSRLGSVTARHSSIGRQPNFAVLNRRRHLYSAGRPSRWALAHILVLVYFLWLCTDTNANRSPTNLNLKRLYDDKTHHYSTQVHNNFTATPSFPHILHVCTITICIDRQAYLPSIPAPCGLRYTAALPLICISCLSGAGVELAANALP